MKYTAFQQRFVDELEKINPTLLMTTQYSRPLRYNWCTCLAETREEAIAINEKMIYESDFSPRMKSDRRRIGAKYYSENREQSGWATFSPESKKAKENKLNFINK